MSIRFVLKRNSPSSQTTNQIISEHSFDGNLFTIGSDSANTLVLEKIAFEQAVIIREDEQLKLINSADGTKLNGELLRREAIQPLAVGDEIGFGNYILLIFDSDKSLEESKSENSKDVFTTNEDNEDKIVDIYATTKDIPVDVYATTKFNVNEVVEQLPAAKKPEKQSKPSPKKELPPQEKLAIESATQSQTAAPQRNFADILDTLRTEDDSFYFTVKNSTQELNRIPLDQSETPIGTASNGEITNISEKFSTLCAVAKKDWSGILIEAQKANAVSVNGEKIDAPRRLRHDDEVVLTASPKFSLVLHEPSSLVALESLLSTRSNSDARFGNLGTNSHALTTEEEISEAVKKESFLERRYFNHFSFVEFASMVIGTLIGAVLIFLLLEFIFS